MADDRDEGFLNRWARRKQRAARTPASKPAEAESPQASAPSEAERAEAEARRQELIDSLPEPEQLGPDDDYTQFLQDGVPDDLRQRALRRLWKSNPVFANLDGLNDYDLDYTDAATVVENLKTAFQAGRGMITKDERDAEAAATERAARGESEPAEPDDADSPPEPEETLAAEMDDAAPGEEPAEEPGAQAGTARARYRQSPDGRPRAKGTAAQRRWGS